MPYILATDLDGTLLREDKTVSERTRDALRSATAAGVEVVYATGRPPRWLDMVYETTDHRPTTICANGALTLIDGEPAYIDAIDDAALEAVQEALNQTGLGFQYRTERWEGRTLKLLAGVPGGDPRQADEVLAHVTEQVGHLVEPTHSAFQQLLIEMGPQGVNKAHALQRLRDDHWGEHTLIAVGDMPNDLALLGLADIPMTVLPGHPVLKEVATHVLPGPDEDGVASILEKLAVGQLP